MIREMTGDILQADVEVLVNPVNTVGVMGAGLALQFKCKYPSMFQEYSRICNGGDFDVGHVLVHEIEDSSHCYVISFPTKRHWRDPSRLEWIDRGLIDLRFWIEELDLSSVAIPALGCGRGGLPWSPVRRLIIQRLRDLSEVDVVLYAP